MLLKKWTRPVKTASRHFQELPFTSKSVWKVIWNCDGMSALTKIFEQPRFIALEYLCSAYTEVTAVSLVLPAEAFMSRSDT